MFPIYVLLLLFVTGDTTVVCGLGDMLSVSQTWQDYELVRASGNAEHLTKLTSTWPGRMPF